MDWVSGEAKLFAPAAGTSTGTPSQAAPSDVCPCQKQIVSGCLPPGDRLFFIGGGSFGNCFPKTFLEVGSFTVP